jgi:Skp family chaperone for outer membrane proteins
MKFLTFASIAACAFSLQAVAAGTAVVDMEKTFTDYYETINAEKNLKRSVQVAKDQAREMETKFRKVNEEYAALRKDSASNFLLDPAALEQKKKEASLKEEELKRMQRDYSETTQTVQRELGKKQEEVRQILVKKIRDAVSKVAQERQLDMVLDSTGVTMNRIPTVVYNDPKLDITNDVLAILNRGHEAEVEAARKERAAADVVEAGQDGTVKAVEKKAEAKKVEEKVEAKPDINELLNDTARPKGK